MVLRQAYAIRIGVSTGWCGDCEACCARTGSHPQTGAGVFRRSTRIDGIAEAVRAGKDRVLPGIPDGFAGNSPGPSEISPLPKPLGNSVLRRPRRLLLVLPALASCFALPSPFPDSYRRHGPGQPLDRFPVSPPPGRRPGGRGKVSCTLRHCFPCAFASLRETCLFAAAAVSALPSSCARAGRWRGGPRSRPGTCSPRLRARRAPFSSPLSRNRCNPA